MNKWMACQQEYIINFRQCLADMRKTGTCADVTLVCDGVEFSAHWLVLSAGSPYFAEMVKQHPDDKHSKVELEGLQSKGLEVVLQFLYLETPEVQTGDVDVISAVLRAANKMEVQALMPYCCQILLQSLSLKNFVDVWNTADKFQIMEVADNMTGFLAKHFSQIYMNEDFRRLSLTQLKAIITSPDLQLVSSDDLLRALLTWAKHEPSERKRQVIDLIPVLDLSSLSNCYWQSVFTTEFLVRSSYEFMQTLQYSATKYRFQLVAISKKNKKYSTQLYNYNDHIWSLVSEIPCSINQGCTYISYTSKIYFIGGEEEKGKLTSTVLKYDFSNGKITYLINMKTKRWKPAAAELKGKLYVLGGINQNDEYTNSLECFEPKSNAWHFVQSPNICRWNPILVSMCGYLYLIGGYEVYNVDNAANYVCIVIEKYDSFTNTWKQVTTLPPELHSSNVLYVTVCMEKLCIMSDAVCLYMYDIQSNQWSTINTENGPRKIIGIYSYCTIIDVLSFIIAVDNLGNVYELDIKNKIWINIPGTCTFKKIHGCVPVLFPNIYQKRKFLKTKLVVFGKSESFQITSGMNSLQYLSPRFENWSSVIPVSFEINNSTRIIPLENDLFIFSYCMDEIAFYSEVYRFNIFTNSLSTVSSMKKLRIEISLAVIFEKIYVIGGRTCDEEFTKIVECYNPHTTKWCFMSPMNTARTNATAATLDDKIYVAGGNLIFTIEMYDVMANQWSMINTSFDTSNVIDIRITSCCNKLYFLNNVSEKYFHVYSPAEDQWDCIMINDDDINSKKSLEILAVSEDLPYLFVLADDDFYLHDINQRIWKNIPRPQMKLILSAVIVPG